MKCYSCWAEKAYIRQVKGWRGLVLSCLMRVPLKCHHCYHKFTVSWFSTLGKQLTAPPHILERQHSASATAAVQAGPARVAQRKAA